MYYAIDGASEFPMLPDVLKPSKLNDKIIRKLGKPIITSGDVHPGDVAPVVAMSRSLHETVFPMIWGIPNRGLMQYQIPAEAASRIYPESWQSRRCVVLASYYYQKSENPEDPHLYAVQPKGSFVCYMAGVYVLADDGYPCFAILTRKATIDTGDLSARMPVILNDTSQWIRQDSHPERILRRKPYRMLSVRTGVRDHTCFV